jgi:hypothetical protein
MVNIYQYTAALGGDMTQLVADVAVDAEDRVVVIRAGPGKCLTGLFGVRVFLEEVVKIFSVDANQIDKVQTACAGGSWLTCEESNFPEVRPGL